MTITYHPNPGTILICKFDGFVVPEMVKNRPVVVVSPRMRHRTGLCTVAPLSTTPPKPVMPWHGLLELHEALSPKWPELKLWAKCDMLYTLRFERLDRFHRRVESHRKYYDRHLSEAQLNQVMLCIQKFFSA